MDIKDIHSVADIILLGAAEKPDEEMIIFGDERITWQQMKDRSSQVANALRADGVGPGDRVAYVDKNGPEYFELAFACGFMNAVTVAVNWRLTPIEMTYIINDAQANVLVIHEELAEHLAAMEGDLPDVHRVVVIGSHDTHISYQEWRGQQSTIHRNGSGRYHPRRRIHAALHVGHHRHAQRGTTHQRQLPLRF